jgi:hypothetical protein
LRARKGTLKFCYHTWINWVSKPNTGQASPTQNLKSETFWAWLVVKTVQNSEHFGLGVSRCSTGKVYLTIPKIKATTKNPLKQILLAPRILDQEYSARLKCLITAWISDMYYPLRTDCCPSPAVSITWERAKHLCHSPAPISASGRFHVNVFQND